MAERDQPSIPRSLFYSALLAAVFFLCALLLYPLEEKFQLSVDEGFNVQRSSLYNQGYLLYEEIQSDQPPLFTLLLAAVLRFSENSTVAARVLVLLFSAINLFSVAAIVSVLTRPWASLLVLPFFFILPWYMHLSIAIMIGLPAIALASLSVLFFILWLMSNRWQVLAFSAFALPLSMLIKLFTGFLAPIIAVAIIIVILRRAGASLLPWKKWTPLFLWGAVASFTLLGLSLWLYGPNNLIGNLQGHFGAGTQNSFNSEEFGLWPHLKDSWIFFILGGFGIYTILRQRLWRATILIIWLAAAVVVLSFYEPVWAHHQLLITVPLVGIQAIGVYAAITHLYQLTQPYDSRAWIKFILPLSTLLIGTGMLIAYAPPQIAKFRDQGSLHLHVQPAELLMDNQQRQVLNNMLLHAPSTDWVVTDMPYFAFVAGLNVPPELATFSTKMIESGTLDSYEVLRVIERRRPEQVLIGRIQIKQVNNYLQQHYVLVTQTEDYKHYVLPELLAKTS